MIVFLTINSWAKGENDSRKSEIANLDNFAHSENDARKNEIANLDNFAHSENDGRKQVSAIVIAINVHNTLFVSHIIAMDPNLITYLLKYLSTFRTLLTLTQECRQRMQNEVLKTRL